MKINVLLVEDDPNLRRLVKDYLTAETFNVTEAEDGKKAINLFFSSEFNLVILDVMMPFYNGFEVLKEIRKQSNIPVVMLTAKGEEYDQLEGFNNGADEYITKPFSPKLLMARLKKLLERSGFLSNSFSYNFLNVNFDSMEVTVQDKAIQLSPKEFDLLLAFIENKNIVLSRERLLDKVWGFDYYGDLRTVDTHIKRLRHKIGEDYIKTVRGSGYIFEVEKC